MEVEFKKDLRHNYMIISEAEEMKLEPYCIKLLEHRSMEGLLPLELSRMDNKILFYYDITAKQSMITILDKTVLSCEKLKKLCIKIIQIIEKAYEYLLPDDDFILTPEYIYLDVGSNTPSLCFLPGYHKGIKEQMSSLMEFLMNKVDYNDKEAVILVYQLYALSREEGYTLDHLMNALINKTQAIEEKNSSSSIATDLQMEQQENNQESIQKSVEKPPAILKTPSGQDKSPDTGANQQNSELRIPVMLERLEQEKELACYPLKTYLYTGACAVIGIIIVMAGFFTKILYNTYGNRIDISKLFALILIIGCVEGYLLNKIWDKKNKVTKIIQTKEYIDPRQDFKQRLSPAIENKNTDQQNLLHSWSKKWEEKALTIRNELQVNLNNNRFPKPEKEREESLNTDNDFRSEMKNHNIEKGQFARSNHLMEKDNLEEDENPTRLLNEPESTMAIYSLKPFDAASYKTISIKDFPFFIGKLKKNVDYCLEKDVVSRYHAKITKEEERFYITDLNSTNGTFVNGEAVQTYQKKEIKAGDEIAFADIKYWFRN